jgi:UDP-glucose 4-epimerase
MNLDEAVDLVKFAFEHAEPGDLFIQKADASTIGDLAKGVQQLFGDTGTKVIGTRHGEKLYETLLTNEECDHAIDLGDFYRVPCDQRDLNYDKYFIEGDTARNTMREFDSENTNLLTVEQVKEKLLALSYIQEQLKLFGRSV